MSAPDRRADLLNRREAAAYLGVSGSGLARRAPGVDGPREVSSDDLQGRRLVDRLRKRLAAFERVLRRR